MMTQTPSPTDWQVLDFCRTISSVSKPVLLPIAADPLAEPLDCFNNVRRKVASEGGRIVYGWAIWIWPKVYIEAEHHAVFERLDGTPWLDITPSQVGGTASRLFVEDASATYDFENEGVRRDNIRLALNRDPLIQDFFESARAYNEAMNALPGVGEIRVSPGEAQRIQALQIKNARLTMQLAMKYSSRNDRCFCGSGQKFKKCHGGGRGGLF